MLESFLTSINVYFPWYSFLSDSFIFQFFFFYLLLNFYNSKNIYYTLLYLFFLILFIGFYLSLIQAELFTGFLWTTEFTVVLISLILFFYLNVEGGNVVHTLKLSNFFIFCFFLFFVFFYFLLNSNFFFLNNESTWLYFNYFFDDWYESLNNSLMNDFIVLTYSYYSINNIEFLIIAYLLLLTSFICVYLNRVVKNNKLEGNSSFLKIFNFFSNYLNFSFLRKQNLNTQSYFDPSVRIFKKKKW